MGKSSKLKHLDNEDIQNLIERYYNKEKISDLIMEYGIECKPSELIKLFPSKIVKEKCPYCKCNMVKDYVSRSMSSLYRDNDIYCPKCKHIYNDKNCSCTNCISIKRNIIISNNNKINEINYNKINDIDKIYLAAIIRGIEYNEIATNNIIFETLDSSINKIGPTYGFEMEILRRLFKNSIISININSEVSAFTGNLVDGDFGEKYYINKVKYNLNINYMSNIVNPNINITKTNINEIYFLAREIILEECYEYLIYQMEKVKFTFTPGKTTKEVFEDLLDKFSLGQVYSIIYNSITNATRYYQEGKVTKKQAANSVITRCRSYGERVIANNWDLKVYSRPYECRQSLISELLFNRIIKIGDEYFSTILSFEKTSEYIID